MEPYYESQSVSMEQGKSAISTNWFCNEMRAGRNSFESNQRLATSILELNDSGGFSNRNLRNEATLLRTAASNATRVTFESLRRNNPHWETMLERIIAEEIERESAKYHGLGSYRGFYTFVFRPVSNIVLARVVLEMWAIPTLTRKLRSYTRSWIEERFVPGGKGFEESAAHFQELIRFNGGCLEVIG
tara:strand:+ start:351 stop:914 length:564 start_codon:yes stop_codon:yes gene_type:complete